SRFALTTAESGAAVGTRVTCEGSEEPQVSDAAPVDGTEVVVADLFFNTPARRKFMRRASTEARHCEEAVVRLALAHPEAGFFLQMDGAAALSIPAEASLEERVAAALGAEARAHLIPFEERRLGITVRGQVASPAFNLPNARGIYTFVNRRYIRDRGLNSALQRAFQDGMPAGRQPVAVVLIELDPRAVDVNVHPQKLEVRFSDGRSVYDAVLGGVRRALQPKSGALTVATTALGEAHYASAVERFLAQARGSPAPLSLPMARDAPLLPALEDDRAPAFGQARPDLNHAPPPGYFAALRFLGTLGKRFWICEGRGATLVVLDPHAAQERVALTRLRRAVLEGTAAAQRALFSATVELPRAEAAALGQALRALDALGLEVEPFGGSAFAVKALPRGLEAADPRALLADLAAVAPPGPDVQRPQLAPALRALACHAAAGASREPSRDESAALFAQLDGADFHVEARHAGVVVSELTFLELERRVARS
ncbi:MAG TPA: DNA mismatch repair endonuclease MutL, partial [Myxococcaceae bacterium]|nr:DNA mismatch repair endonuclease MutL [Myxococcaceae bacterium]